MKFFNYFIKKNKILIILFIVAICTSFSYELTNNMKEWFNGADFLFSTANQLSLGYMSGFIFYAVQTEYATFKRSKETMEFIISKLETIHTSMVSYINILLRNHSNLSYNLLSHDEKEFEELYSKLKLDEFTTETDENGNQLTVKSLQIRHKKFMKETIAATFISAGSLLENEVQDIINSIGESRYLKEIECLENTKLGNQSIAFFKPFNKNNNKKFVSVGSFKVMNIRSENLYEYYTLSKKLEDYIKKWVV